MAVKMKITYADGRVVEVTASPRAQVQTERHYAGLTDETRQVEVSYYLAWASLSRAGMESAEYEPWLDLIEEVEEVKGSEPRPTPEIQPSTSSSD